MITDERKLSEETLQKALAKLAIKGIAPAIISYFTRSTSQDLNVADDISEDELAYLQLVLMQEAARDVGLHFGAVEKSDITEFGERLKKRIVAKISLADDALRQLICVELNYCKRVGNNWRGKILFGSGLALAALLADVTGLSLASILYLLSIGYFDELCECTKVKATQA